MSKYIFSVFLLVSIISTQSLAQSPAFEGEVNYTVTYTNITPNLEPYAQNLPKTFDVYIRQNLVCKSGPTALMNGYQINIKNLDTQSGYLGTQLGGTAVAYRLFPTDYQEETNNLSTPTSIEYVNETKTIAGYVCKKALVYFGTTNPPLVVYYTTQIPAETHVIYKGLKGFPLYFEINNNGVTFYAEAKSVHPGKQDDSRFLMPKKYRLLSKEAYNKAIIQELEQ